MIASPNRAREIFVAAVQLSPEQWDAYLTTACEGDEALRDRVQNLLIAHREAGSFLEPAVAGLAVTTDEPVIERLGTLIGPYKLLQQIGEGGMGTVFMAEQTEPIQRKVALKIIKAGMDSRQVIARFEAERQALAMMDHVNIARVFDGGATEHGRPYFVMELVHGVPITKYCDDNHLTPRQRLELFVPVCQAIQHAHQKGIIHRDIKPSNVMVTLYDGKPVSKVIDFGVAKATEQKLTERTLFTQYGTMVGTLEYMSPEQAEMSALGIDTRSDIYSLGVLLYELLTGSTPLSRQRMKDAAYAEILRMIKEEEPPKPSTRLSDSGEALASISAQRQTEPAKLTKLVRGELDWIVMKTLEKDRNRRYETANGFAMDVQRYLTGETVQAVPPSVWYRVRKLARRNRGVFAAAVTAVAVVLLALAGLAVSNVLVTRERDRTAAALDQSRKNEEAYKDQLGRTEEMLHKAIIGHDEIVIPWETFNFYEDPEIHSICLPDEARRMRRALEVYRVLVRAPGDLRVAGLGTTEAYSRAAYLELGLGELREAEATVRAVTPVLERLAGEHPDVADYLSELTDCQWHLGRALEKMGRPAEAEQPYRTSIRLIETQIVGRLPYRNWHWEGCTFEQTQWQQLAWAHNGLGRAQLRTGRPAEAEASFLQALVWADRVAAKGPYCYGGVHSEQPPALGGLARARQATGRPREAEEAYRRVCGMWEQVLAQDPGNRHGLWNLAEATISLADFLKVISRDKEAGEAYRKAVKTWESLVAAYPAVPGYPRRLSWFLATSPVPELRDPARAVALARTATDLAPLDGQNWTALAAAQYRAGNWGEALTALEKATSLRLWADGRNWFLQAVVRWRLGDKDGARTWYDKAAEWTARNDVYNDDLRRLKADAAELLGGGKK